MSKPKRSLHLLHHGKTHHSKRLLIGDLCGWVGAVALLTAYFLASAGVADGQSLVYQLLNAFGAAGMLVLAIARHAVPSAVVNIIWAVVGIFAIFNLFLR